MFKTKKHKHQDLNSLNPKFNDSEQRAISYRRVSCDIKYLGLGKCIDRRKNVRRKEDRFDKEAYERLCQERLGPGWL